MFEAAALVKGEVERLVSGWFGLSVDLSPLLSDVLAKRHVRELLSRGLRRTTASGGGDRADTGFVFDLCIGLRRCWGG